MAPLGALAVKLTEAASTGQRSPISTSGLAALVVLRSFVAFGPMPRSTMPLLMWIGLAPFTRKSPADSCTTWPAGHALMAAWMPFVASELPFPYVDALTVAHTLVRAGTPPG